MTKSKSNLVNQARQGDSRTENGAVTNSTTLNSVLDLFFLAGSARALSEEKLERMIASSYQEDALSTLKLIFWAGDIRGGAGERRFFKVALNWLYENDRDSFYENLDLVSEFSRWDVLFQFADDVHVMTYIYTNFKEGNGLLAKWMPRKKQYNNFGSKFRKMFDLTPKEYRKSLVALTDVVETKMCAKEFGRINYEHVPSIAMKNYRTAFYKNDEKRFDSYINAVTKGEKKINAKAIFPTDIIKECISGYGYSSLSANTRKTVVAQWNALPNYLKDSTDVILPVCDCSGSMYPDAIVVALALTLYISERNNSIFKDAFITFSSEPSMNYLEGDVVTRLQQIVSSKWGYSTNLLKTMKLVLDTAIKNKLSQEELPNKLMILSDMEFNDSDVAGRQADTINDNIKQMFADAGYKAPQLVYWNIEARSTSNFPVSYNDSGVALISGQSPSIIKSVLANEVSPVAIMKKTLDTERYSKIQLG